MPGVGLYEIAFLSCRILSIYLLCHALIRCEFVFYGIGSLFQQMRMHEQTKDVYSRIMLTTLVSLLPLFLTLILGVYTWRKAGTLATRIIGDIRPGTTKTEWNYENVQCLAFSVVGLLVLAHAIPDIFRSLFFLAKSDGPAGVGNKAQLISLIIEIFIGLGCFLGSRWLVGITKMLRNAGKE